MTLTSPTPVDAEVRPLSGAADWEELLRLRRTDSMAANDGPYVRAKVVEAQRLADDGQAVFVGAFHQGRLVSTLGIVSDGLGMVRYQHVQTDPDHRRQGLAGHLTAAAAAIAHERWSVD